MYIMTAIFYNWPFEIRETMQLEQEKGVKGIILMGGSGSRFGSQLPKQFHRIAGKKVYLYTLEQFLKIVAFEKILLVCPERWVSQVIDEASSYGDPRIEVIAGGGSRQESSFLALQACGDQTRYVVIHDGVRPFVSQEILWDNIKGAVSDGAVDTCIPSADTIVHAPAQEKIEGIPLRSEYWRGQTPQSFSYPLILKAHLEARKSQLNLSSDDCSLAVKLGHPVKIVMGSEENIKITTELDLFLAEQILRLQQVHLPTLPTESHLLKGKHYAVTGGTGGIGQAIVKQLQKAGAVPILISRTTSPYKADFTSAKEVEQVFETIHREIGPLDGLINCFGKLHKKEIASLSADEIEELIGTNLTGTIYCCKWAHIKERGHIINIASSSYVRGKKEYAVYAGTKAAVVNFTQGLAEERPDLYVNSIIPQRTHTPMRLQNFPNENLSELLDPEEVASHALALLHNHTFSGSQIEVRKQFKPEMDKQNCCLFSG
ncbi:MAG: bifunctional cytidylyltransferase/SDR family oxidoreductase [Parachlamydiales bacterium]|nr:bifunctional cytidylyltransferase/SDR family oxidoreductase [Candidatus Acheromyda pituitae]